MAKKITRSTVNEQQYSAPEFSKSGFPLSYRRYSSFMLGRIHIGGFHWTMPGDKISGMTSGKVTFKRIVTPIVSPVNAMQYNVYLPLRPLDRTFKKGMTPTKLNSMSANWSMPTVTTRDLVDKVLHYMYNDDVLTNDITHLTAMFRAAQPTDSLSTMLAQLITDNVVPAGTTLKQVMFGTTTGLGKGIIGEPMYALSDQSSLLGLMANDVYMLDALQDIYNNLTLKLNESTVTGSMKFGEFLFILFDCLLTPFVGRYSYFGELKYNYLRPMDIYNLAWQEHVSLSDYNELKSKIDDTPCNEYPLRAMYAIWYELFRNVDLEPVSPRLPDWQEFGSTSIFDFDNDGNLMYLVYRIRSWEKDMFISAQIDDLSRHVYAPILSSSAGADAAYRIEQYNNHDTQFNAINDGDGAPHDGPSKPSVYTLNYLDNGNNTRTLQVPVPSNINDVLSATDNDFNEVYGLDLNTLRQSQMLEKYLKRNYLFGDEYQDRMLAHYNSRVSDMRINKPEILSQSLNSYEMKQEVSNVSTDETKVGQRTATATVNVEGTEFSTFCEEFGLVFSIVCFMPRAMYDGINPQLLCVKQIDMPLPEFATNNEEFGRKMEIASCGLVGDTVSTDPAKSFMFGRYPAYHAWRSRVDEVGGEFLDELQDCTFRRFFGMFNSDTTPKLNYFFIHCRPNLSMFADTNMYSTQLYGDLVHDCFVERVLPTPVETI